MDFDHVGIVTDDIESLGQRYASIFGLSIVHEEELEQLRVAFLELETGYLELLEPMDPDSSIASYLQQSDTSIHHIALTVDDITDVLERVSDHGVTPIDETPRRGAWGHQVAFLHPKDTGGVLLEFVQA